MGMNESRDLPDKTLQFIRDRPLMEEAVRPLTGGPLLVKKGALLTRIVVDSVLALDRERYSVMFIGTGKLERRYSDRVLSPLAVLWSIAGESQVIHLMLI